MHLEGQRRHHSHQPTHTHTHRQHFVNPRRACAARVTVLCLFGTVCVCVSDTTLQASVVKGTTKLRHQRSVNDTLQCFDSWILLTMRFSRDMAKLVSQEAYDRASLPETSAHVINHMLLQFVIEHVLFFQSSSVLCAFPLVSCLICSSKPLCNACPGCGGQVWFILEIVSSVQASFYATLVLVVVVWFM